jgi:hypothetical protein
MYNSDSIAIMVNTEYTRDWNSVFGRGKGFPHIYYPTRNGALSLGVKRPNMMVTNHFYSEPRSRMSGASPLLPLCGPCTLKIVCP